MRGSVLLALGVALAVVLALAGHARADVPPPPEYQACEPLHEGDECAGGGVPYGACVPDTCSRLSYPADGGTPTTIEYDCLYCEARPQPEDDEGCAVRRVGVGSSGWLAALAVPVLFTLLLRRRRRR